METPSKSTTAILAISKISLKRRVLIAASIFVVSITVDILMFHYGLHATGFADLITFTLALLIIFRPQWLDRWNEKNRREIENSDPDLRRWM
jgi:hypothetical protein